MFHKDLRKLLKNTANLLHNQFNVINSCRALQKSLTAKRSVMTDLNTGKVNQIQKYDPQINSISARHLSNMETSRYVLLFGNHSCKTSPSQGF